MDKCQGVLGKLFGHSYRPAITKGEALVNLDAKGVGSRAIIEMVDKTRKEAFHGIYCKRCGKVINA
ncbi:hypothetical protein ACN5N7_000079 [Cronobacter sakazakii]